MRNGDWIQTYSGRQFWPIDPRQDEVSILDIAHSLALQCRFTGHCHEFYSVAEHSIRVSYIVPAEFALWGLLHDASEAYMTDLSRPIKRASRLGEEYREIERRLMAVICQRFRLPKAEPPEVKTADNVMLMTEKRDLMESGGLPKWAETAEPLQARISPMDWRSAKAAFLNRFAELVTERLEADGRITQGENS